MSVLVGFFLLGVIAGLALGIGLTVGGIQWMMGRDSDDWTGL